MVWQKYCLPSSPVEINLISPSSVLLPCKDRQERLWQDSVVVAMLQAALALFPLGLRFVFSHVLKPKENHAFGVHVSVYCILFGWGEWFSQVLECYGGRMVSGRSWVTLWCSWRSWLKEELPLQLFLSILVFFIPTIAVYELGENTQCHRSRIPLFYEVLLSVSHVWASVLEMHVSYLSNGNTGENFFLGVWSRWL